MNICILGSGLITKRLAEELSFNSKVQVFTSREVVIDQVSVSSYPSFLNEIPNFDIVVMAWRGLPERGSEKSKVLRHLVRNLSSDSLVLNLSSVSVYGQNNAINIEESGPRPINSYGLGKYYLERYLDIFSSSILCHLRISNVFGDPLFDDIINRILTSFKSNQPLILVSPENVTRDYISTNTVLRCIQLLILSSDRIERRKIFNISSGFSMSLVELTKFIEKCVNSKIDFTSSASNSDLILNSKISNQKILDFLQITELTELTELTEFINSMTTVR